jgi:hypothetical protein
MGKIRTLSEAEAGHLRKTLLESFQNETGRDFTPVTYLGAYNELRSFLLEKLSDQPEVGSSVSLHRLRKLFYYTDPAFCPEEKLETLSFGDDFITLLNKLMPFDYDILQESKTDSNVVKPHNWSLKFIRYFTLGSILPIAILLYWLLHNKFQRPYYFRDDFHDNSLAALKSRGWEVIDFDSSLWFPQDTGVLTLRSSRGDYWVRPLDTPYILNTITKEVPRMECFEIVTKFTFWRNKEPWQQCGIILLDKNKNRIHNIRFTFAFMGETEPDINGKILNRGFQILKRDHGEAEHINKYFFTKEDTVIYKKEEEKRFEFFLKIEINGHNFRFYNHRGEESDAFSLIGEMPFKFTPKYFALVSFNGLRINTNGPLNTASSIPAKFDWVKVVECE